MITQASKHHGAGWPAHSKVSKTHLLFFTFNRLIIPYQKSLVSVLRLLQVLLCPQDQVYHGSNEP